MGTGKTSIGKRVAERLGFRFIDTDEKVKEKAGKSIAEIFSEDGEAAFRDIESKVAAEVSGLTDTVISTGGGIVTRSENMERLQATGFIVCLTASPGVIFERIGKEGNRPLLQAEKPLEEIERLLKSREAGYSHARLTLDTSVNDIENLTDKIILAYQSHLREEI
jgi:shikimate kinase